MTATETRATSLAPGYGTASVKRVACHEGWPAPRYRVAIDLGDGAYEMSPGQARRLAVLLIETASKTGEG